MANTQQATRNPSQQGTQAQRNPDAAAASVRQRIASNENVERRIDATRERTYWSENYDKQKGYVSGTTFGDYEHAYRTGYDGFTRYPDMNFSEAEPYLRRDYESLGVRASLAWAKAKSAVHSAWDRVERAMPGDFDRDGR